MRPVGHHRCTRLAAPELGMPVIWCGYASNSVAALLWNKGEESTIEFEFHSIEFAT